MSKYDIVDIFKKRTRSPLRPRSGDVIRAVFPHFRQHPPYKGSLVLGEVAQWDKHLYIIGQQKPTPESLRTKEDLKKLNHGMLTAEEHSYVWRFIERAVQQKRENGIFVTFIDTYGADISMESAKNFQAFFIGHLIKKFIHIPLPTMSIVLGEGGSGGALALQYTDRRAQMDDALYATAPPESMAAIIFRDPKRIKDALTILKPTAEDLHELGVIDHIIPSPRNISDLDGFAKPISAYIEKTAKELSKIKLARLMEERRERAGAFGLPIKKRRKFRTFLRKTPLKGKPEELASPDMKIFTSDDSALQVRFDYGDGIGERKLEYIKCGETNRKGAHEEGCGAMVPLDEYLANYQVCPHCGRTGVMGALGWIDCLTDKESFYELYRDLTVGKLLPDSVMTPEYREFLTKQGRRTTFREALVTGEARVYGHKVVMAVCEFFFSGGSMGVVFGEKFNRAVEYAIENKLPLISLCCSGGARLYEGILALMQMAKTVNAVETLKDYGLPFISILADPSTGGALASYAALGDVILAEPEAMVIFAGPRVMVSRGFEVDDDSIRAQSLHQLSGDVFARKDFFQDIRGIHEVAERKDMRRVLAKYLEFYEKTSGR